MKNWAEWSTWTLPKALRCWHGGILPAGNILRTLAAPEHPETVRSLVLGEQMVGPGNPETVKSLQNLTGSYLPRRDAARAIAMCERILLLASHNPGASA
jgi:hypothetical protein